MKEFKRKLKSLLLRVGYYIWPIRKKLKIVKLKNVTIVGDNPSDKIVIKSAYGRVFSTSSRYYTLKRYRNIV